MRVKRFGLLKAEIAAGNVDAVITMKSDTPARDWEQFMEFMGLCEEQNINTLSGDGEMMLAVLSSFAQEESRSMSENRKWTLKKKFEQGEIMINTTRFLVYDMDEYGGLKINEKEALIVAFLYDMTLLGYGSSRLAALLNWLGVKPVAGGEWHESSIKTVLSNEKYKGDYHLQKTFTPENRRGQTRPNRGEVKSYYITDNHPAIVSADIWDKVQEEREQRKIGVGGTEKYSNRYPLSGMLVCPYCGKNLRRVQVYNKKIQWLCSIYIKKGKKACQGVRVNDIEVAKQNITEPTVVEVREIDGKKYYRYTSKAEYDSRSGNEPEIIEKEGGSVLPSVNRPRRTVIKL